MTPELDAAFRSAVAAMEALGVRGAVVGGLAVSTWAAPSATRDVDLYAALDDVDSARVKTVLERYGLMTDRARCR